MEDSGRPGGAGTSGYPGGRLSSRCWKRFPSFFCLAPLLVFSQPPEGIADVRLQKSFLMIPGSLWAVEAPQVLPYGSDGLRTLS